ncbi:UTRA domain-containing protein [Actinomycetaceae bacterium L2_0104]
MGLDDGELAVVVERVRGVDGTPWAHTTSWVSADSAPDLEKVDLRRDSLYRVLRETYGLELARADRSIEAVAATEEMAEYLQLAPGVPLLRITSILHGTDGRPVETFVAHHPGDRSRFDVSVGPDAASAQVQMSESPAAAS